MAIEDKGQNNKSQFVDATKAELDESVSNISARDLSAITQARYQALDKESGQKSSWIFIPVGVIATACLAIVVYSFVPVSPSTDGQALAQENQAQKNQIKENQELVSAVEDFDFYEDPDISEELDFHEWLDAYESSS